MDYNWKAQNKDSHGFPMIFVIKKVEILSIWMAIGQSSNVSATPIGQTGLKMGCFPLGNGVCLIMKKAPSDSPIWQLK